VPRSLGRKVCTYKIARQSRPENLRQIGVRVATTSKVLQIATP
jgi:hypothetical protein